MMTLDTRNTHTSCGARISGCQIRSGLLISPTSILPEAMCIWRRSSTSIRGRYCHGAFPIRLMPSSVFRLSRRPSPFMGFRRSLTRIRVASLPRTRSRPSWKATAYRSVWTALIVPWIISSSNASGVHSSMRIYTSTIIGHLQNLRQGSSGT